MRGKCPWLAIVMIVNWQLVDDEPKTVNYAVRVVGIAVTKLSSSINFFRKTEARRSCNGSYF